MVRAHPGANIFAFLVIAHYAIFSENDDTISLTFDQSSSELLYQFDPQVSPKGPLFWHLPPQFLGSKVNSYDGNLTLIMKIKSKSSPTETVEASIIGNGITLIWKDPELIQPEIEQVLTIYISTLYMHNFDNSLINERNPFHFFKLEGTILA